MQQYSREDVAKLIAAFNICKSQDADATEFDFPTLFSTKLAEVNYWLKTYQHLSTLTPKPSTEDIAVGFAEWADENWFRRKTEQGDRWTDYIDTKLNPTEYTTKELFQLYLTTAPQPTT
jgi:hypothetical protein